jgi:lambda family phage portal protein
MNTAINQSMRVPNTGIVQTRPANAVVRRATAQYLRDSRSNILSTRPAVLTNSRDDIRRAWRRSAGLAMDMIQNSGRLSGAADQVIADTVGSSLELAPKPDLPTLLGMGYDEKEVGDLVALIKREWNLWSQNPAECDHRGKLTVAQMIDIGLRWHMAYGEVVQVLTYMGQAERSRYGIKTGGKVMMVPPSRLVQDTNEAEGLFQGVFHDTNGRPVQYRFLEKTSGFTTHRDYPARDHRGIPIVVHIFDPNDATDVRGISKLAPAFRKHIQHEMLDDATVQTAILQTVFAATLSSPLPSADAFEGIEALLDSVPNGVRDDFKNKYAEVYGNALANADKTGVNLSADPQISHLAPGEDFKMHGTETPGPNYQPFSASLDREMARAIGITYESFTLDNTGATYASSRVGSSSIWPVVSRRRMRISAPQAQAIYDMFLDEKFGTGVIPLKGGYRAFNANRQKLSRAQWRGPAKPSADDNKSAQASGRRLENRTSSLEIESAELGFDHDELVDDQIREHKKYREAGMASPYDPKHVRGEQLLPDDDIPPNGGINKSDA